MRVILGYVTVTVVLQGVWYLNGPRQYKCRRQMTVAADQGMQFFVAYFFVFLCHAAVQFQVE